MEGRDLRRTDWVHSALDRKGRVQDKLLEGLKGLMGMYRMGK